MPLNTASLPRTLLLAPPSLSSHPERLENVLEAHDRASTDIQMLDRLSLSLVTLPPSAYETIILLTDADNTRLESRRLLHRDTLAIIVAALKAGGTLRSQDGTYASTDNPDELLEATLSGLVQAPNGVTKPDYGGMQSVPLRRGENRAQAGAGINKVSAQPAGVGFVDFSDDFDTPEEGNSDDELIDENTLLDESDLNRPIIQRKSLRLLHDFLGPVSSLAHFGRISKPNLISV